MNKRKIVEYVLHFMAKAVLRKYHPLIVGITGSVGKSSAKEAVALVLSRAYAVRKAEGNYNNEIGIPLTIIGVRSGGRSLIAWTGIVFRWFAMMIVPVRYPEVLVLEMGVDRPGDMDYLLGFVSPHIAIVTGVSSSHLAFFGSVTGIAREKGKLPAALLADGYAILNIDDKRVEKMKERTKAKVITYGFSETAELKVDNLLFHRDVRRVDGFSFKANYDGKTIPVRLPHIIGRHHIGAALAAMAAGVALKMNLVEIAEALEGFESLPGRLRLLPGKDGSILLDDTYNASPASVVAAFQTVKELMAPRKVAILGDMLELGADAESEHRALGEGLIAAGVHIAIVVGQHMRVLSETLLAAGFSRKQVFWLPDPFSAVDVARSIVRADDLVLIKGSRGMRMEKITEALLADPKDAKDVLCCQSPEWRVKPFAPPEEWTV